MIPSPKPTEIAKPMPVEQECPYCRCPALTPQYSEIDGGTDYTCAIACDECGASGPDGYGETKEDALTDANRLFNALCAPALAPFEKLAAHIREVVRLTRIGGRSFGTATALEWAEEIERHLKHE